MKINIDEQNLDKLTLGFIGEILREKIIRESLDKLLAICQICQTFPPANCSAIQYSNSINDSTIIYKL